MSDTGFPPSRDDDAEDVAWALLTGRKLWLDGERVDALVWLRRASSAATEAGEAFRAEELAHAARVLREAMEAGTFDSFLPPPLAPGEPAASEGENVGAGAAAVDELLDEVEIDVTLDDTPVSARTADAPASGGELAPASSIGSALLEAAAATSTPSSALEPTPPASAEAPPAPPPLPAAAVHAHLLDPWADPSPARPPLPSDADVVTSADRISALHAAPAPSLPLDDVEAFADLPDDARERLALAARIAPLAPGEEVPATGLVLVVDGEALVQPTVADATAAVVRRNGVVLTRGTLASTLSLRIVAGDAPATIALWDEATIDAELASLPWVQDELRAAADRLQALAGATLGPLGDRLDDALRESVLGRLEVRVLAEGDVLATAAAAVPGLTIVGAGEVVVEGGGSLAAGDILFPNEVLGAGAAPATARVAAGGAIVLFGTRRIAQELLVTCPPLVEALSSP